MSHTRNPTLWAFSLATISVNRNLVDRLTDKPFDFAMNEEQISIRKQERDSYRAPLLDRELIRQERLFFSAGEPGDPTGETLLSTD